MAKKLPEDKVEKGIVFYRSDWDYLKELGRLMGQPPSRIIREWLHEWVGVMQELAPKEVLREREKVDVRVFVKKALTALSGAIVDMAKLFEGDIGDERNEEVRMEKKRLFAEGI